MPALYFTPAVLSYLSQFILALLIAGYFVVRMLPRHADRPPHRLLLTGFFACIAALTLLLTLEAATSPTERLQFLFPQTTVLALSIVLLLQFAYHFPRPTSCKIRICRKWSVDLGRLEAFLVLALSLLYLLSEAKVAGGRFDQLTWGEVNYRPAPADYPIVAGLLWVPIVFLRRSLAASVRQSARSGENSPLLQRLWCALWRPRGQMARAQRAMALVYLLPFAVGALSILRSYYHIPQELLQISRSLGIIVALAAFAVVYINYLPETTSFMVRLVGIVLATLVTLLAAVGWLVAPAYAAQYHPVLPDQRTLRFTPNSAGGYDVSLAPFHFESDPSAGSGQGLGADLHLLDDWGSGRHSAQLNFAFPFYGQPYDRIYINHDGTIALGRNLTSFFGYALHYGGSSPMLLPLLLDLNPGAAAGGGVFARQEPDRLIVTWQRVPGLYRREDVYTFQARLYATGVFEFSYAGLPASPAYRLDDEPSATVWAIGAAPGDFSRPPQMADLGQLAAGGTAVVSGGPQGLVHDYYLDFRRYLDTLLRPLAYLMLGASLFMLLSFPWLFRLNLVKPLETLLAGVRRVNAGDLGTPMPIHYHDEIGFLTESFNGAAVKLHDHVATLERRVAERTADLTQTNARLCQEMDDRQAAQAQVLQQEHALAASEERERLGRELHDGLGQVMGYVNVQAQAIRALLQSGQIDPAVSVARQLEQVAQDAHADVRAYILGIRTAAPTAGVLAALRLYLDGLERTYGLRVTLAVPPALETSPGTDLFAPEVEAQLLRIIQEALTNVRKHAGVTAARVSLALEVRQAEIVIADEGVGFDLTPSTPPSPSEPALSLSKGMGDGGIGHFGLSIMAERARAVGGSVALASAPGQGTRVTVQMPLAVGAGAGVKGLRVLLADDHPLFLDGLRNMLTAHGLNVVGLARDGVEAAEQAIAVRPDLALLDIQMPRCDGLEAARRIKGELPDTTIVMLTVSATAASLFGALKAGASGYILKSASSEQFLDTLASLLRGEPVFSAEVAARILADLAPAVPDGSNRPRSAAGADREGAEPKVLPGLTERQTEVLRLVAQGLTYKEVGACLHIAEITVKYHMGEILNHLHVQTRKEAVAYAVRSGLGRK